VTLYYIKVLIINILKNNILNCINGRQPNVDGIDDFAQAWRVFARIVLCSFRCRGRTPVSPRDHGLWVEAGLADDFARRNIRIR
jgi:hypothetical protein